MKKFKWIVIKVNDEECCYLRAKDLPEAKKKFLKNFNKSRSADYQWYFSENKEYSSYFKIKSGIFEDQWYILPIRKNRIYSTHM